MSRCRQCSTQLLLRALKLALELQRWSDGVADVRVLLGAILMIGWIAYVATTGVVAWRILSGQTPSFLKDYTLGADLWAATASKLLTARAVNATRIAATNKCHRSSGHE
jgi:hypothetical protein